MKNETGAQRQRGNGKKKKKKKDTKWWVEWKGKDWYYLKTAKQNL
jgi:hypothetical protein